MFFKYSATLLKRPIMGIQSPTDICYGSMAFFMAILHNIFLLYHVDMFVSVYKIDKYSFWVGEGVFLVWNSLNDPLFGWLSDRKYLNNSGKTSQYEIVMRRFNALQINGPLFAISFIAFWIPWAYPWLQFVVCLCLYDGFLTMLDLHHSALLADLSVSADIRTSLNFKCSVFSAMGSASVFMSYAFWNKDDLSSFRSFCCVLAVVSFVGFLLSSSLLKKYYIKKHKEGEEYISKESKDLDLPQGAPTKSFISQLLSQKNFLWFAAMNLIQVFHCHFNSNFFPLFLENLLGDAISPSTGSFLIGISFVAPHINNLYFLQLCRRFGVYSVIYFLFVVKLTLSVIMFLVGSAQIWLLCVSVCSNRVFTEGTCRLLNLVISDLVDEDYVIHDRRQPVSALMFGTAALVSKPGQTLAPLIGTLILSMQTGHDIFQSGKQGGSIKLSYNDMDTGTRAVHREGCFHLLVYVPIICAALQLLVWTQFSLHGRRLAQIKSAREGALSGSHV
ncbi:transmembrane protein 180-like [Haliotis rubra]|uniref:transmembrane protein 180-like n=1 Tax=Haliotis rubra TaxID=36100 RepID=UPI001EE557F5|nr:transmembrane protein 180-like [Haliotis rubra]